MGAAGSALLALAGSCFRVTVFDWLCQRHKVDPLRITSVSLIDTGIASLMCVGSAYQTLMVCEPASSAVIELGLPAPGSWGTPSAAVSTTVPVSAGGGPECPTTAASSCAAVRAGSSGAAWATLIMEPAVTPAVTATTPAGTAHRVRREIFSNGFIAPHSAVSGGAGWRLTRPIKPGLRPLPVDLAGIANHAAWLLCSSCEPDWAGTHASSGAREAWLCGCSWWRTNGGSLPPSAGA